MRELLFTLITSIAALAYIICALVQSSRSTWFAAAYVLLLAVFAWAHGRGRRWGRLGSALLVFGLCVPIARELLQQWAHLGSVLIAANWMGWAYQLAFVGVLLTLVFFGAVILWLVLPLLAKSTPAHDANPKSRNA
jgi:hypothetical protein